MKAVSAAHAAVALHIRYNDFPLYDEWLKNSFNEWPKFFRTLDLLK